MELCGKALTWELWQAADSVNARHGQALIRSAEAAYAAALARSRAYRAWQAATMRSDPRTTA
ncbi:hypothetical protein HDA40_000786 [Hamadaea flava]|nr:hypothetical protein [Hamadaea flava]